MIWVNIEDHFRVVSTQKGADIGEVFERLAKASKILSRHDEFAHSDTLGFLTCCPSNLGTGLQITVTVNLPNLGHESDDLRVITDKFKVKANNKGNSLFEISNKRMLGISEVELV